MQEDEDGYVRDTTEFLAGGRRARRPVRPFLGGEVAVMLAAQEPALCVR